MKTLENWSLLIFILICFFVGGWFGWELGKHKGRVDAVEAGVGEFYLPGKYDVKGEFRWKTNVVNLKGE